jgi:hypothetical protein
MGLDQYLYRKHYVKQWEHEKPEQKHVVTVKKGGKIVKQIKPERISEVTEQVAYWRKANQIHKWFVDNVQDGDDDCKEYYVSDEQIQELVDLCAKVLANSKLVKGQVVNGYTSGEKGWIPNMEDGEIIEDPSTAAELLPNQKGFFFGGLEYDQWYLEQIKYTHDTLKALLAEEGSGDFYYDSSW